MTLYMTNHDLVNAPLTKATNAGEKLMLDDTRPRWRSDQPRLAPKQAPMEDFIDRICDGANSLSISVNEVPARILPLGMLGSSLFPVTSFRRACT
jgi:hypothetical protein